MSNNERKTSKLAIAGLIVSVAIPGLFFLCVLAFESLYKQLNGALEILILLLIILPFLALPLSIAGVVISKKRNRKGLIPGTVGIILSAVEIIIVIITIIGYFRYVNATRSYHTRPSMPPHTGTVAGIETADIDILFDSNSGTKQLTLDDVIELSSKGEELVWEDLEEFKGYETGSGLYIMKYKIDDDFSLVVGGTAATGKPMYAHLIYDGDEYVDIMTEDAEVFISGHS